ncbi:MAG: hypothetical protein BGN99_13110 [Alphaproteobacteria bacterium 65-37]|jgi:hypothetical protein|nr:MAG: hypothetical protein BGN99_13110 [Alphaproteobacteria bacterium 65-37]
MRSVEVLQGQHEEMFPMLASARIDLMAAVWLPEGHGAYWARYGEGAQEIARLYDGARFFWAVPSYVPPDEVVSIEDLAKPSVAARMTKLIHGIGPPAPPSRPCPGRPSRTMALTDVGGYRVYRKGELVEQRKDIRDLWQGDLVAFLIGCSFTFEHALIDAGVGVRSIECNTTVTARSTCPAATPPSPRRPRASFSLRATSP